MEIATLLQQLGLNEKEAAVYLAALSLAQGSMTELTKKAELKRPTVYLAVERLQMAGLLSQVTIGKQVRYSPAHPRRLLEIAQSRARHIEAQLPELVARYNTPQHKTKLQVFEGSAGVKLLYQELYQLLSKKEEALFFTNIEALRESLPEAFNEYKKLVRTLYNPKIRELNIGNEGGKWWFTEVNKIKGKNHYVRLLPTTYPFGACDNLIIGNKLAIFSLKESIFVTVIEDQEIAQTYRAMFEWAWRAGK